MAHTRSHQNNKLAAITGALKKHSQNFLSR